MIVSVGPRVRTRFGISRMLHVNITCSVMTRMTCMFIGCDAAPERLYQLSTLTVTATIRRTGQRPDDEDDDNSDNDDDNGDVDDKVDDDDDDNGDDDGDDDVDGDDDGDDADVMVMMMSDSVWSSGPACLTVTCFVIM